MLANPYIELLKKHDAIRRGDFVTKSGRRTNIFVNTGAICSGSGIAELAKLYAHAIHYHWPQTECLFGPAYKAIPLAVATAAALHQDYRHEVTFSFNRKEAKDHGEGGWLCGDHFENPRNTVIIEDVLTAGTSLRESLKFLQQTNARILGVVIGLDRQEDGSIPGTLAREEIEKVYGLPVRALATMKEL